MNLIEDLKEKYPQIDPSKIYITGLSAGGSKATLLGIKHPDVFAAVAAVHPGVDKQEVTEISEQYTGPNIPYLYICGDHDNFQMIRLTVPENSERQAFSKRIRTSICFHSSRHTKK